jgi:hypothetical protein
VGALRVRAAGIITSRHLPCHQAMFPEDIHYSIWIVMIVAAVVLSA